MRYVILRDLEQVFGVNKSKLWTEVNLSLNFFVPRAKFCRLDFMGEKSNATFVIESKLYTYPQNIGFALGQIFVYYSLIKDYDRPIYHNSGGKIEAHDNLYPFICFNAFDNEWSQWGETEDRLVQNFNKNFKVGVLLMRVKPKGDVTKPDDLFITCRIDPFGLFPENDIKRNTAFNSGKIICRGMSG